jgi:hypothetical protein
MTHRSLRAALSSLCLVALALACAPACSAEEPRTEASPEPWLRLVDVGEGRLKLEVGERVYTHPDHPSVTMIGAIHIADPRYYDHLDETLKQFDLVLYEGVGPEGAGEVPEDLSDEERVERTESRIRLLAMLLERDRFGATQSEDRAWEGYPETLDDFEARLEALDHARALEWLDAAREDAWGNPLRYELTDDPERYTILSYGADAEAGGRGVDRDLSFALQPAITDAELGASPNIQQQMARTFGLAFQLEEMSHDDPTHVNSDLSIDEVRALLEEKGGDGTMIFGMLDGSGGMAAVAGTVLRAIEFMPGGRAMGKLMMMEMLANADQILEGSANQPGMENMGALFDVIINDRNAKVIEDLQRFLKMKRADIDDVAIIYGVGHMPDLEERLIDELGYELAESDWNLAMRLDVRRAGISEAQANMIRMQIRTQLEAMRSAGEG